ncbi:MAG: hypothetical protein EPN21_02525 [Methylococcaceae bacterium]|nr:MAG: hypothetical protein EPN21_02525 [Methylococcaceae bacterium]
MEFYYDRNCESQFDELCELNLSPYFIRHSERAWGGGFVDMFLAPFFFRYADMRHGYLIELKYLKRGEDSPVRRESCVF